MAKDGLTFGIYPGGPVYDDATGAASGAPDDAGRIDEALAALQPAGEAFVVRTYHVYTGGGRARNEAPADCLRYLHDGRTLDLVLCCRLPDGDLDEWTAYVRGVVQRYGPHLDMLQICEEPNSTGPGGDGATPNILQAVVRGLLAAKEEAQRRNFRFRVGFNATPSFDVKAFWGALAAEITPEFLAALDYVAFDFFADVYRPVAPDGQPMDLRNSVQFLLRSLRETCLPVCSIPPSVPVHIGENGWPTTPTRTRERQADVLETVVRTIYAQRAALNITHYEHFCLRDGVTASPELGYQFGLMTDTYEPKPAFERYRRLIAELGA